MARGSLSRQARRPTTSCRILTSKVIVPARHPYTIEFYADPETGREHVREWIKEDLTPFQRRSIGIAMSEILEVNGINVCDTEYGKNLGQGLFEFRLRHGADDIAAMFTTRTPDERDKEPILLRVYCHAYGDKIVLLLAGYDKQADASKKRENQEIKLARKRLTEFKQQRRLKRLRRSRTVRKPGR